jgi:arginyl-tRNA synthetase
MLRAHLEEIIRSALNAQRQTGSFLSDEILLAAKAERGDFACPIAIKLAGKTDVSAKALAQAIANAIDSDLLAQVEVADNGFINFTISKYALSAVVHQILTNLPSVEINNGQTMPTNWLYVGHRLSAALRQLTEPRLNLLEKKLLPAVLGTQQIHDLEALYLVDMSSLEPAFDADLLGSEVASSNKELALLLDEFTDKAGKFTSGNLAILNAYIDGLSRLITQSHILDGLVTTGSRQKIARIGLITAAKRVFGASLGILNLAVRDKL